MKNPSQKYPAKTGATVGTTNRPRLKSPKKAGTVKPGSPGKAGKFGPRPGGGRGAHC